MRILVCEDQKDLNKIITKHLTAEGYSADSCYDGQEALDFMDMADYDAVILDVMIPKKTACRPQRDAFSQKCDARFVSHRQRLYRRPGQGPGPGWKRLSD